MPHLLTLQHGVLRRDQAVAAGVHAPQGAPAGTRVLPNVYSVIPPPLTVEARWWAAVLYGGHDAALAGRTAAEVYGWLSADPRRPVELLVPHGRQRSSTGFVVVRRTRVPLWKAVRGLPVSEPPRTIITLGASMSLRELTAIMAKAAQRRDVRLQDVVELAARHPQVPGARAVLRAAATLSGGAESITEVDLIALAVRGGLDDPLGQVDIFDGHELVTTADAMWLRPLVGSYYDGRTHLDFATQDGDAIRTLRIKALGIEPVRVTAGAMRRPQVVIDALWAAHRTATAAGLPPSPRLRLRHRGQWLTL